MPARREHHHGSGLHAHYTIRAGVEFGGEVHRRVCVAHGASACDVVRARAPSASARPTRARRVDAFGDWGRAPRRSGCRATSHEKKIRANGVVPDSHIPIVRARFHHTFRIDVRSSCASTRVDTPSHGTASCFRRTLHLVNSNDISTPCAGASPPRARGFPPGSVELPCRTRQCQTVSLVCKDSERDSSS